MDEFNVSKAIKAQKIFCSSRDLWYLAPANGICPHCLCQIYNEGGISVENATKYHVSDCPFCRKSFL